MTTWILVLFLRATTGGSVTQIEYTTYEYCMAAKADAKVMETYKDAACIKKR